MESLIIERACGLDVHKDQVTACAIVQEGRRAKKTIRVFRTFSADLLALADWLKGEGITHVAMESTGVYWKPVYVILESVGGLELIVGNAQHIKNVPGRKTDVKDAEWLAQLVQRGMIAKSYVPPADLRELRDLTRYRRSIVQAATSEKNRLLKLLESANIKLASVASDVFGVSGRMMLHAIAEGVSDPKQLSELAKKKLRKKIGELQLALDGKLRDHHRMLLRLQLERLDEAEALIARLNDEIEQRVKARYENEAQLLCTIPGVQRIVAAALIAEMGVRMDVFRGAGHFSAWAGVAPGCNESAGKRGRVNVRKGNIHLCTTLVEAAQSANKTKGTYLSDKYHRLKARRGAKRAIVAIAHKIAVAAYTVLSRRVAYKELTDAYLDRRDETRVAGNLVRRLERLGYTVTVAKAA